MADIAQIGFVADTSQLDKANTSLQKLVPSAQAVETAAQETAAAIADVGKSAAALQKPLTDSAKNVKDVAAGLDTATRKSKDNKVANDNTRKAAQGLSADAKNLSYQLVDVAQGLASGQRPFQIFAQQAGQIGQVLATSKAGASGLFKEIGAAVTGFLTPMRLAVAGVVALGAAFYSLGSAVVAFLTRMDDLSKSTDVATGKLHALQQATSFKGISEDEFATAMESFAKSVSDANHNVGDLNGLMIASGKSARDLEGYLANVADIVAKTSSGVQRRIILEAAGLPTTQAWVRFMAQGGDAIRKATENTVGFSDEAEKNLVAKARAFDEAWNKATTNVSNYLKSMVTDNLDNMSKLMTVVEAVMKMREIYAGTFTGGARPTQKQGSLDPNSDQFIGPKFNPQPGDGAFTGPLQGPNDGKKTDQQTQAQLLEQNRQAQQRISLLGDMATVEQQVTLKQKELNAANLQGVGITQDQADKVINATRAQAEMTRVQQQATIGIYDQTAARKAAADTLQMWIDKGLIDKNNVQQMAAAHEVLNRQLQQTKEAAEVAAAPLQQLKQLELDSSNLSKQLDGTLTQSLQGLVSPIQDVLNGVTSLGQGFKNMGVVVLKAIQEMIIKMLILAPIAKGLKSIFGGWFGDGDVFGTATKSANGNVFGTAERFANGGTFTNTIVNRPTRFAYGGKIGEMGEAGPEAVMPLQRGPDGSLGVQMYGGRQANDNAPQVTYAPQYNVAQGADPKAIQELKSAQAKDRREFVANVAKATTALRKHNVRV